MTQTTHNPSSRQTTSDRNSSNLDRSVGAHRELRIADLTAGQGLTDRYDDILLKLCNTSPHASSDDLESGATRFCHHVKHALNADTAYICSRASLSIMTTSSTTNARETCEDTQELHTALTSMVSDLWNCDAPLSPPDIKVFPEEPGFSYQIVPLATQHDHLLIIANADIDNTLIGDYLGSTLTSMYEVFLRSTGVTPTASTLEIAILDELQHKYRISSKTIIKKRLERFQCQLKDHAVEFEGLSVARKTTKTEALKTTLPEPLYRTAQLWNKKFKALLDCHALIESAYGYRTLCDNEHLINFSESRSLKVGIHAESLTDLSYIATLQDLTEKSVIHPSRLQFAVIPKSGHNHSEALRELQDRFGITATKETRSTKIAYSIADEFDIMQINGVVKNKSTSKQK